MQHQRPSNRATQLALAGLLVVLATSACLAMPSIESEPVKVTHRNSGPRYEIAADNEVERTKIPEELAQQRPPPSQEAPPSSAGPQEGEQATGGEPQPIGHLAIRRIYLFPMMTSRGSSDWSSGESDQPRGGQADQEQQGGMPSMFAKPFWPFLTPARPSRTHTEGHEHDHDHDHDHDHHHRHHEHRPHLFGADEASRSPSARPDQERAESGEREGTAMAPAREPLFDPIQMMLDMMHQAINAQMVPPQVPPQGDLNKNDKPATNDQSPSESSSSSSDERPTRPGMELRPPQLKPAQNETREEIVEIEGKKYLRKTIVNRHVGENLIFMTKRLIFVPLNETETPDTTTETVATTTTGAPVTGSNTEASEIPDRVGENKPQPSTEAPASTTTTTTTTTTASPTTTTEEAKERASESSPTAAPSTEQPTTTTTTTTTTAEPTTPKATESFVDRVSDVIEKAAERLVEETKSTTTTTTSTTQAPVASSTSDNKQQ